MGLGISMRYGNGKVGSPHETRQPHPERFTEDVLGNEDELLIFMPMLAALMKAGQQSKPVMAG
jgi:hypothetical protein